MSERQSQENPQGANKIRFPLRTIELIKAKVQVGNDGRDKVSHN